MLRKYPFFMLWALYLCVCACKKPIQTVVESDVCLRNSTLYYQKKWAAVYSRVNYTDASGAKKTFIIPAYGYFDINFNSTYKLLGDPEPSSGKWSVDKDCNFILTPAVGAAHKYTVKKLTTDSLVISEVAGNVTTTLHYSSFKCPDMNKLAFQWDNIETRSVNYSASGVTNRQISNPKGYIRFNPDAGYVAQNNGAITVGTWGIAPPDCDLILDKGKKTEKSYMVEKLTTDSLKLWYKDTVTKTNYIMIYKKRM
ncbi:hypothetical protein [Mucilaginibacter auburnensis]|uniref:Lipocalin-like protein n=1 Tax=Mucilaginibacter auburnensis TaxID=1457233 RepID=A0A2H9VSH1_9SPHI|nr:hypothetical protein [Mucilaginibacter auburnensis]PJJ83767.1 hypothetical protein CLV57_0760 [Mucilaginibacter auburnensis]